ncbi:MAG TPA: hypothetical protein VG518_04305 [Solirubrobacterales bacterium]|nr:hypothetical protein [Solirubrobacterales bacterium]
MTSQPFARSRTLIAASLAALAAVLALAGPASAHHGHRHLHAFHDSIAGDHGPNGTVSSFDPSSGKLAISLGGGDSISGYVTEETRIEYSGGCHGWSHDQTWDGRSHRPHRFGWAHWNHGHESDATTAGLTPGAVVDQAFLALQGGRAVFFKIELEKR